VLMVLSCVCCVDHIVTTPFYLNTKHALHDLETKRLVVHGEQSNGGTAPGWLFMGSTKNE
jgi:hypothetical protein